MGGECSKCIRREEKLELDYSELTPDLLMKKIQI